MILKVKLTRLYNSKMWTDLESKSSIDHSRHFIGISDSFRQAMGFFLVRILAEDKQYIHLKLKEILMIRLFSEVQ